MKTFQFTLTAVLLLGLTTATFAQLYIDRLKQTMYYDWNNENPNFRMVELLRDDTFREGIGVSKEQFQIIQTIMSGVDTTLNNDPRLKPFMDEMNEFEKEHGNPFVISADTPEEAVDKFRDIRARMGMKYHEVRMEEMTNAINDNLTSDQLKRVKEFRISTMSEYSFISPSMFDALNLSDGQKEQLEEIKKLLESEFEKHVDKHVEFEKKYTERLNDGLMGKLRDLPDDESRQRFVKDRSKKIQEELQPERNKLLESSKALGDKLKIEMFDVLTDEQWNRMVDLIDNPPDYVKAILKKVQEQRGVWVPGPNSWRPGDPIPEGYRQQRQERGRFPHVNQSE